MKILEDAQTLDLDEPFFEIPVWRRIAQTARRMRELGAEIHLTGHGGDEVLLPPSAFIFEALKQNIFSGTASPTRAASSKALEFVASRIETARRQIIQSVVAGHVPVITGSSP